MVINASLPVSECSYHSTFCRSIAPIVIALILLGSCGSDRNIASKSIDEVSAGLVHGLIVNVDESGRVLLITGEGIRQYFLLAPSGNAGLGSEGDSLLGVIDQSTIRHRMGVPLRRPFGDLDCIYYIVGKPVLYDGIAHGLLDSVVHTYSLLYREHDETRIIGGRFAPICMVTGLRIYEYDK